VGKIYEKRTHLAFWKLGEDRKKRHAQLHFSLGSTFVYLSEAPSFEDADE
jgi:hypothetical protein